MNSGHLARVEPISWGRIVTKKAKPGLIGILACLLMAGCNLQPADTTDVQLPLRYLEEPIPPCLEVAGANRGPCGRRKHPQLISAGHSMMYQEIPNYWDLYYDPTEEASLFTPHLVVRGTYLPETTRCASYRRPFPVFRDFSVPDWYRLLYCFTNARINDYLIGTGPPNLTIASHSYVYGSREEPSEESLDWAKSIQESVSRAFEGREGIMFLAPSTTTEVETWWAMEFWDVQRTGDTVKVVAP